MPIEGMYDIVQDVKKLSASTSVRGYGKNYYITASYMVKRSCQRGKNQTYTYHEF